MILDIWRRGTIKVRHLECPGFGYDFGNGRRILGLMGRGDAIVINARPTMIGSEQ